MTSYQTYRKPENGFWHVELNETSSVVTTFGTPFGRYRWIVTIWHLARASGYFQDRLNQAIGGLLSVRTVADDILISGEGDTIEEVVVDRHTKLIALLQRCKD